MLNFIKNNTEIKLKNNKIYIPSTIKHIKLDIGLSYNAPHSQIWLNKEKDLIVFGFEPHEDNIKSILSGPIKTNLNHGDPIDIKYVNNNFFLIPCALGLKENKVKLYSTENDSGCSSIFEPNIFKINKILKVDCFTLKSFFEIFPFDDYPIIEYIKIDAQGSDLDIIKSGGNYISENVAIITLESEQNQYKDTNNSFEEINNYMKNIGFEHIITNKTIDPTFVNKKFKHMNIYFEQIG